MFRLQLVYTVILKFVARMSLECHFLLNRLFLISSTNGSSQATVFEQVCAAGSFFTDVKKEIDLLKCIPVIFVSVAAYLTRVDELCGTAIVL